MVETKDISGFMLMRSEDGTINIQVIVNGSSNMSVVTVEGDNINIASMLDSLCTALDVEGSLAEMSVDIINQADIVDATAISAEETETPYVGM